MQTFIYTDELNSFVQLMLLGLTLSLPVCFTVENMKNSGITDKVFYFILSGAVSALFGILFSAAFTEMSFYETVWLMILLWLGSQGFYEKLKSSDSPLGKMFVSLSGRMEEESDGDINVKSDMEDETEDETEGEEEYLIFPVNYVGISTAFSAFHPAVDFGFSNSHGGKNQPIIAPGDMEVVSVGENASIGKYIRAFSVVGGEEYTFRFIHMSETCVKKGEKVKKGYQIGKMGNTGSTSNGYHLHFDIWKGHVTDQSGSADRYKNSVDPLKVCYLAKDQIIGDETHRRYDIKRAG